jgi:inositol-hexakisphosphate 5-kinase
MTLHHISRVLNQSVAPENSEVVKNEEQPRIVSHSQQQQQNGPPQVIFENNRHIIPENLFKVPSRPTTPDPPDFDSRRSPSNHWNRPLNPIESVSRDGSPKPQIKQWGSTYVNRKLQEQVLREVFAPPVIHKHRHVRRQHLAVSEVPPQLSSVSNSTPASYQNLIAFQYSFLENDESKSLESGDMPPSDIGIPLRPSLTGPEEDSEYIDQNSIAESHTPSSAQRIIRRRHSGGGLRRRPLDIVNGTRTHLEFHEEEASPDRDDGVFPLDMEPSDRKNSLSDSKSKIIIDGVVEPSGDRSIPVQLQAIKEVPNLPSILPNPRNPVQARIQPDERNEMFILLEDLTSRMRHPCVLDLKMGTRQYGIEADERKQRSQRRKCAVTTSLKLGVRVCGMQVWNVKTQSYLFEDKYFGRDLKAGGEFQSALTRFFFDGLGYASALRFIPVILEKLTRMERMIRNLPGYRFYASSLLILYDRGANDDSPSSSPEPSSPKVTQNDPPHFSRVDSGPPKPLPRPQRKSARPSPIKIKIVDFANCVTAEDTARLMKGALPPKNPDDVDRGYLRGLRTLRIYFQRIWKELSEEEWVERGEGEGMALGQRGAGRGTASKSGWEDAVPYEDPGDVSV